jgi:hypothetical protein
MSAGYGPNQVGDGNPDGTIFGGSATEKIGFYGATPVVQRASSVQATLASSTDFAAAHAATLNEIVATLTALGLWKGGA